MHAIIHDIDRYRNAYHVFKDRFEAGDILAQMLEPEYKDGQNMMVLGIPSGGVPVGLQISKRLNAPFDLIIVRKIQIPNNPEAGFGAISLGGGVFLNKALLSRLNLSPSQVQKQIDLVKENLEKRNRLFRKGSDLPDVSKKTVILVDDGLASGYTMMASIHDVRQMGAQKIIVAVPTAPKRTVEMIAPLAEEIYCANIREAPFFAVAEAYSLWYDLSLEEVVDLLNRYPDTSKRDNP